MFRELLSSDKKRKTVINLNSEDFENGLKQDENAVLIDVRTEMENRMARIPNSLLIDLMDPDFISKIDELDRSKSYYLYCRSGNRSYTVGNQMIKMGFENVCHLLPGIIGWKGEIEKDI